METLNVRLKKAYNVLIEKRVFFEKYNQFDSCVSSDDDDQLQLVTNYLSLDDVKIILCVCELYSLKFGIIYAPSATVHDICVIFDDSKD